MPPQADAEVAVLTADSVQVADALFPALPQAAVTKIATTAKPRWRVRLRILILLPLKKRPGAQAG